MKMINRKDKLLNVDFEDVMQSDAFNYSDGDIVLLEDILQSKNYLTIRIDFVLLIHCVEGSIHFEMDNEAYRLNKNDLLICGPQRILTRTRVSDDFKFKAIFLNVNKFRRENTFAYDRSLWDKVFYLRKNPMIHLTDEQSMQFQEYYNLIVMKLHNPSKCYHKQIMHAFLAAFFLEILSYLDSTVQTDEDNFVRQSDILFKRFLDMLTNSEVKSRFVYYYADKLNVSTKYLSAVCKNVSGRTAGDIIDEYVINDIVRMLRYSDKSIKEIALELDFPNISFFGKYVKAHLGVSPKAYRKQQMQV